MPYIPLKEKPFTNVDSIGNSVAIEAFNDADKDDFYNNKKRKGLLEFVDLGTGYPIDGIFNPIDTGIVAVFSDGKLFKVEENGTVTQITGDALNRGTPVKMADFSSAGYFCNNSKIMLWVYANATNAFLISAQAPTTATFLGFIKQYLVALTYDSQRFSWSDVDAPETWLGEFAEAESRPDKLVALSAAFGEVLLPGTKTIEHWGIGTDPTAPFENITGTETESGSLSGYSFAQVDNSFMYLNNERHVVRLSGRNPQIISNPFDAEFQALDTVSDCIGIHFNAEGDTKYVLTFPTADKTYVYDYKLDVWSRWSEWISSTGTRKRWLGNCGVLVPSWNKYLVGSKTDGKIYYASADYDTDNGENVQTEIITGRINWGTSRRKSSSKLRLHLKRGVGGLATSPVMILNYRDNGNTEWKSDKNISLGIAGDEDSYITFRNLGTYRDRQYRFRLTSGNHTLLVSAEEEFTVI
jgi:hypothetical protein